jgi:hypothetical protein
MFERAPLEQLPETLSQFNDQLQKIVGGMGDLPRRLGPLSDLLGGAASMFGLGRPSTPEPPPPAPARAVPAAKKVAAKKTQGKETPAKKSAAKKTSR